MLPNFGNETIKSIFLTSFTGNILFFFFVCTYYVYFTASTSNCFNRQTELLCFYTFATNLVNVYQRKKAFCVEYKSSKIADIEAYKTFINHY